MKKDQKFSHSAQALVETAILLMVLLIIIMIVLDLGRVFYYHTVISNAAREGARYGIVNPFENPLAVTWDLNNDGVDDAIFERAVGLDHSSINIIYDVPKNQCDPNDDSATEICCTAERRNGRWVCFDGHVNVVLEYTFTPVTPLIGNFIGGGITVHTSSQMAVEH